MENDNILYPIELSIFKEHIRNSFLTLVDQVSSDLSSYLKVQRSY